ncbi:MAG TPA: prepilin-type N-terminal cleavage/methylation domain-containing protein [Phycisphaerales bacterium]|nr:prepilin-type N-terminal cleavage/methylation domain-containing protein [Phycisphaerales bacterium]
MMKTPDQSDRTTPRNGFTLTELILATLILSILAVGSLGYQYVAARDVRNAEAQAAAARLAKLVLDGWKGLGGSSDYDPTTWWQTSPAMTPSPIGPAAPDALDRSFRVLGRYQVQIDDVHYYLTCFWSEATEDKPRVLNVAAAWRADYQAGPLDETAREVRYSAYGSR